MEKIGLLNVDEKAISVEESKNATLFQKVSGILGVPFFLLSFYLVYRFFAEHDFHGIFVFVSFFLAAFFLTNGSIADDKAKAKIKQAKEVKLSEVLSSVEGFSCSQRFVTERYDFVIAIDDRSNQLCLIDHETRLFAFNDVLEVEIVEDEVQITKTSRGSQLGGAIIGGVLAGGVGAVIGGVAGQKITCNDKVRRIYIKLIVNDTQRPYVTIDFLNEKKEILKKDKKAMRAISDANHWYGLISVLIKRAG